MDLLSRFLPRREFADYADFKANYKVNIPERFNFGYDVVDVYAKEQPDKLALIHVDPEENLTRYSFADIALASDKCAAMLASHGIGCGDAVMLMLRERVEAWITIIALCKLGAISIPATFLLTPKDIVYRCEAASVKAICYAEDDDITQHIRACRGDCKTLESVFMVGERVGTRYGGEFIDYRAELASAPAVYPRPTGLTNDDTMLIYFTSGTASMPKMVAHTFAYPLGHITTAKYWQQVEDDGVHLTFADSGWAKFAWGKIYGQWIAGTALVAFDTGKFDAKKLLETMEKLKLTTFCAPPTTYRFMIKEDLSKYDLSSIKHCCTAGEPLYPEVTNRWLEATGNHIYEGFGQTESSVLIANFGWDEVKPGSTGKPSPLYDINILDADGKPCEDGIVGRIVVCNAASERPVGLFREYVGDDAAMAKSWRDGMYDTGDMAWCDSDGYYHFEGRSDDVIKCSGYRIGPFEVESALQTHPAVLECAVTAAPDAIRGQVVKATVVLMPGYEPTDELRKELQNHVKHTTAPYKYPRILEFAKSLPKTTSNKIRRAEIRSADEKKFECEKNNQ